MGPFARLAEVYRCLGFWVIPLRPRDKKPCIQNFTKFEGPPSAVAVERWAKQFAEANIGFVTGRRSGLTVVDLDDPALLDHALERFGPTPLVVNSGSGKSCHLYYRSAGERNAQRIGGQRIDLRGEGGYIVAPGSIHGDTGRPYVVASGSLEQLRALPEIRPGSLGLRTERSAAALQAAPQATRPGPMSGAAPFATQGYRNDTLLGSALRLAKDARNAAEHAAAVRLANIEICLPPLEDDEVAGVAASAWRCEISGRNWVGTEGQIAIPQSIHLALARTPDALALFMELRRVHGHCSPVEEQDFAVSPKGIAAGSACLELGASRVRKAVSVLLAHRLLVRVHEGGSMKGDPHRYRFGCRSLSIAPENRARLAAHKGSESAPNTNQTRGDRFLRDMTPASLNRSTGPNSRQAAEADAPAPVARQVSRDLFGWTRTLQIDRAAFAVAARHRRLAAGLSQEALARVAGISRASICKLERGRFLPSLATAEHIAAAVGVAFSDEIG